MKITDLLLSLVLLSALLVNSSSVRAQDLDIEDLKAQVQEMYIAYYGRPGDAGGVGFWAERLQDEGGDLGAIIESFGNSTEFVEQFGGLSETALINNIFLQLFGRDADSGGLNFYLGLLQRGEKTLASIALDISNGVQDGTDDEAIINNKLAIAAFFTDSVETMAVTYGGEQITASRQLMANVAGSQASRDAAQEAVVALLMMFPSTGGPDPFADFVDNVSDDVLQSICIACHVFRGLAADTRLVYVRASNPDYHSLNYQQWVQLALDENDVSNYVLRKVQGMNGHGGGVQAPLGSDAYIALENFLQLLTDTDN